MLKKNIFFLLIISLFITLLFSYVFKNFQLLILSFIFFISFLFFFKQLNKNFILLIFSLMFPIFIIETGLFFFNNKSSVHYSSNTNKNIKVKKTYLGQQPLEGKQHHKILSNGLTIIDNIYTIKNDNFRYTPPLSDTKKNKNINFFGGSETFGWGLDDKETLPYLIQSYLPEWEINNYAISGWGVQQMLAMINKEPNIVADINILVTYSAHVPRASCKRDFTFGFPRFVLNDNDKLIRSGYCNFGLLNKLSLPPIIGSILNRSEIKKFIDIYFFRKSLFDENDLNLYIAHILNINTIIKKKNKIFLVGYFNKDKKIDKYILEQLNLSNISIINLTLPNEKKYTIPNDGHSTKIANVERSKILSKYIRNIN